MGSTQDKERCIRPGLFAPGEFAPEARISSEEPLRFAGRGDLLGTVDVNSFG